MVESVYNGGSPVWLRPPVVQTHQIATSPLLSPTPVILSCAPVEFNVYPLEIVRVYGRIEQHVFLHAPWSRCEQVLFNPS